MPSFALSTWSLHRTLGTAFVDAPGVPRDNKPEPRWGNGQLSLLELPAELKSRGYSGLQICHFHLPSRSHAYLDELRNAIKESSIDLDAMLIDDGDLTHPLHADRDEAWIAGWLETSAALGANKARLIAGKSSPTPECLAESARRLGSLAESHVGLRLVIENWMALIPSPAELHTVMRLTEGRIGLCIDFGNWSGANKYEDLSAIARYAETCHAKCSFADGHPDEADFTRCLNILAALEYDFPLSLIYDGPSNDEWACLAQEMDIVRKVFPATR